jgi:uncharacterized protein YecT (DUF1311 family)
MKVINVNACCNECVSGQLGELNGGYGQGHFKCNNLTKEELNLIKSDLAWVSYENDRWILITSDKQ